MYNNGERSFEYILLTSSVIAHKISLAKHNAKCSRSDLSGKKLSRTFFANYPKITFMYNTHFIRTGDNIFAIVCFYFRKKMMQLKALGVFV